MKVYLVGWVDVGVCYVADSFESAKEYADVTLKSSVRNLYIDESEVNGCPQTIATREGGKWFGRGSDDRLNRV